MARVTVPSDLMRLLAELQEVFEKHFEEWEAKQSDMWHLAPCTLLVEFANTRVELLEEGWDFTEKEAHL